MKLKGVVDGFSKHFNENLWYYLVSILFVATGMILGLYCVKYMGAAERDTLINYIGSLNSSAAIAGVANKTVLFGAIKNNLPLMIALWICGITIVGVPIILLINAYKGFTLGFTFSFFIYGLKQKGILLALLGALPQNIIYIPCFIILSVFSMQYSVGIIKEKFNIGRVSVEDTNIKTYTMLFIIVSAFMVIGFLIEGFVTPSLVKFALKGFK